MVTLRASGAHFDVDAFLQENHVTPAVVFRRGEPRFPASQPNGPVLDSSGINIGVSEAEFGNLEQQTREALRFLADNFAVLNAWQTIPESTGLNLTSRLTAVMHL